MSSPGIQEALCSSLVFQIVSYYHLFCEIVLFYINCTVESFSNYEIRCSNHIFPEESGYRKIALSNRVLKKGLKPVSDSKSVILIGPVHKDFSYYKM